MVDYLQRESNQITIASFYENYQLGKYEFSPPYQRHSLWSEEKKAFLIDSILKNFPMPPIFLHQKIDNDSGKTSYDVIDGKQRLTAITEFIGGEFPVMSDADEGTGVSGLLFSELTGDNQGFKSDFWRYVIPIEYVDTDDKEVIDSIFDRLNRNGEPLNGQELRQAKYHGCLLLQTVHRSLDIPFWAQRTASLDKSRMEDVEFLSELLFLVQEGSVLHANQQVIDDLYEQYHDSGGVDYERLFQEFRSSSNFMEQLELDYESLRIGGVSHVYGLFSFCHEVRCSGEAVANIKEKVAEFYEYWKKREYVQNDVSDYKASMSARTKSKEQREKRKRALTSFVLGD